MQVSHAKINGEVHTRLDQAFNVMVYAKEGVTCRPSFNADEFVMPREPAVLKQRDGKMLHMFEFRARVLGVSHINVDLVHEDQSVESSKHFEIHVQEQE